MVEFGKGFKIPSWAFYGISLEEIKGIPVNRKGIN